MSYKLKCWRVEDIRTDRVDWVRAKNRRNLDKHLGERADRVLIKESKTCR